jgi:cytochrome P450
MNEAVDFETVDFFRDDTLIPDPYPYFDYLRAKCPVQVEPNHNVVMVTGYDEACEIYSDAETFSSCLSVSGPFPGFPVPLVGDDVSDIIEKYRDELPFSDQLPTMDPPMHRDHRGLLMKLLTPARLRENEDGMAAIADRQIDAFIESGRCDVVADFGNPFTFFVIADLLGVPAEDQQGIHEQFKSRKGTVGSTSRSMGHAPLQYLYDLMSRYIEDRRKNPRADVMTGMAQATFEDGTLPEVIDVVRVAANLFAAGQETTVRLLGTAFQLIAERPELQDMLRSDQAAIPNFVEECLRYESPVKGDFRLARVNTKVGGVDIPAGTIVMVVNGGANHDARKFENPKDFRPDRSNARQHLAFGRGIHTCPGGPLARAEGRVSLERFLARAADIKISEEHHGPAGARRYSYVPTYILRGLRELHLDFTPKR